MVDYKDDTIEHLDMLANHTKRHMKILEGKPIPEDVMREQMRMFKEKLGELELRKDKVRDALREEPKLRDSFEWCTIEEFDAIIEDVEQYIEKLENTDKAVDIPAMMANLKILKLIRSAKMGNKDFLQEINQPTKRKEPKKKTKDQKNDKPSKG